jgi:ATP-dependent DNA ligase
MSVGYTPHMRVKAKFIEPMLLLKTDALPNDAQRWEYQIKLDGYRAIKTGKKLYLRSRNDNDFGLRYPAVVKGLAKLPDETVIDGEIVALDGDGRPSFNVLQNHGSSGVPLLFFVFDVLILAGRDVMKEPLTVRRALLESEVLPKLTEPVRYVDPLDAELPVLIESAKANGLEGLVAKRLDSRYEPGLRSAAWMKMRVNRGQEFVIGGYTVGATPFDALIFGYYEDGKLIYAARTRNGLTPTTRGKLFKRFKGLETAECPFANLPEAKSGRWRAGLTANKMKDCHWLKPPLWGSLNFSSGPARTISGTRGSWVFGKTKRPSFVNSAKGSWSRCFGRQQQIARVHRRSDVRFIVAGLGRREDGGASRRRFPSVRHRPLGHLSVFRIIHLQAA